MKQLPEMSRSFYEQVNLLLNFIIFLRSIGQLELNIPYLIEKQMLLLDAYQCPRPFQFQKLVETNDKFVDFRRHIWLLELPFRLILLESGADFC